MAACPVMLVKTYKCICVCACACVLCVCVCARACTCVQAVANSETGGGESSSHCLFCHDISTLVFILPSTN